MSFGVYIKVCRQDLFISIFNNFKYLAITLRVIGTVLLVS
jgi:hypothetical protein